MSEPPAPAEPARPRRRWLKRLGLGLAGVAGILFVAVAAAWIVIVEIPARRLPATVAALEAKGETLDLAALAPPPIPDDQNAAVLLQRAFAELNRAEAEERTAHESTAAIDPNENGPTEEHDPYFGAYVAWRDTDSAIETMRAFREHESYLREYSARREPALALAEEALRRPVCRFDLPYENTMDLVAYDVGRYEGFRELARQLELRAFIRTVDGKSEHALEDCARIIGAARALGAEPFLTSYLASHTIDGFAVGAADRVVAQGDPPPQALRALAQTLEEEAADVSLTHALQGERAFAFGLIHATFLGPLMTEWDKWQMPEGRRKFESAIQRNRRSYFVKRYVAASQWYVVEGMTRVLDAATLPHEEATQALENMEAASPESAPWVPMFPRHWLISQVANLYPVLIRGQVEERAVAELRTAAIGCRLAADMAEGAAVPETLEGVPAPLRTDPFTETDLRLTRTEDALVVYSVGMNGQDDGGVFEEYNADRSPDIKDDIAFRVPLRTGPNRSSVGAGVY